ncbi:MAG: oxidoreductase [Mycobacterium leprae]
MEERRACIVGASGLVGGGLVNELLMRSAYDRVTILVRRKLPLAHPKLEQRVVDFDHLPADAVQGDDCFCCLGTTIKKAGSQAAFRKVDYDYPVAFAHLAKESGARQYLIVTAMGADARSGIFYNRVKGEAEEALKQLGLPGLHIFRPSLLLGNRHEFRLGEAVAAALSPLVTPFLVGGMRKYRPIQGYAVARAMRNVALDEVEGTHIYPSDEIARLGGQ